ncbi:GSCFA domain-containing protein [Azospirillum sp. B506]|uniref:GSCFA domain-containing protein n=1 Tax=Azospirillum sp. B506 TaxID=137721 RepID=UPI001FCAB36C|nr:GSCFA domain-containing protein [Azospirillum sp. B506]
MATGVKGFDMTDLEQLISERNGHRAVFNGSWYRGPHTNFIASKAEIAQTLEGVDRWVMQGWSPQTPFITRDTRITAFGSCFAGYITSYLRDRGYAVLGHGLGNQSHIIRFGEGMVNSFAILQQLEWAIEGKAFPENLWFSDRKEIAAMNPAVQAETREIILNTDLFIITLGLSEIWYDKRNGEALWRAVPAHLFDERIHGFRISSHQENLHNLMRICSIIHEAKPESRIVFTVSPIPLMATFRPISCITANSVSKSILRSAVDQLLLDRADDRANDRILYFPSYEMVKDFFSDPYEPDNRHPRAEIVDLIMKTFERHYCPPDLMDLGTTA